MSKKLLFAVALSAGLFAGAVNASVSTPAGFDRTFTFDSTGFYPGITPTSGVDNNLDFLVAYGDGNMPGSAGILPPTDWYVYNGSGFSVHQDGTSGNKADSKVYGSFDISSSVWHIGQKWYSYAIGLKLGENDFPTWAIFGVEQFAKEGEWTIVPKQGGTLSHYTVFFQEVGAPNEVPLPGAAWMMLTGLIGFLGFSNRKKTGLSA